MNDYKEIIRKSLEVLSYAEQINPNTFYLTRADLKIIAADIEQLVKERDAAVKWVPRQCGTCKHFKSDERTKICFKGGCADWKRMENWEWRGVQNADS